MCDPPTATPLCSPPVSLGEEETLRSFARLAGTCQEVLDAYGRQAREFRAAKQDLQRVQDELTSVKGVSDILFTLVENLWALVCACRDGNDELLSQTTLEVVLDATIGRLDSQSLREAQETLRRENQQLRDLLLAATG
ncbi:hypothetical protein BDQ94DRAFT_176606 [Aspergillus welwitschiae]|uniref:Uncharacterized protein n=1 Tax=Aspergillus welwitschiae TaxID=1341132 RepID=A0A3F3PH01_9EURO|nr:hypothetical protein BDQ94DRAFT_176606 [Aspergillus welwitschiae]RDH26148.1 hypothetical protein BDQ94DRAFT_176606 [Aspergillus welwitschiae]